MIDSVQPLPPTGLELPEPEPHAPSNGTAKTSKKTWYSTDRVFIVSSFVEERGFCQVVSLTSESAAGDWFLPPPPFGGPRVLRANEHVLDEALS